MDCNAGNDRNRARSGSGRGKSRPCPDPAARLRLSCPFWLNCWYEVLPVRLFLTRQCIAVRRHRTIAPTGRVIAVLALLPSCLPLAPSNVLPVTAPLAIERQAAQGCGADRRGALIGQPFTALASSPIPGGLRILYPGQGITDGLTPARLNAQVDGTGRILRLFCG